MTVHNVENILKSYMILNREQHSQKEIVDTCDITKTNTVTYTDMHFDTVQTHLHYCKVVCFFSPYVSSHM